MSAERAALAAIDAIARSALYVEMRASTAGVSSEIATAPGDGLSSQSVTAAAARAAAAFGELAEAVERAIAEATR
jgi:hypothetical protein